MFLQNELTNYRHIKVSDDLKEKIRENINITQKKNKIKAIRFAAAAALLLLAVFGANMYLLKNHVLSIENIPVLYSSRTIDEFTSPSVTNFRQEHLQICIPLKVRVYQDAKITVSDGTITTNESDNSNIENQVTSMHIKKSGNILWYISATDAKNALCIILANSREYVYELFYDEENNSYNIRQLKK